MTTLKASDTDNNIPDNGNGQSTFEHTEIKGRFNQYTSGYWALALPALAARYIGRFGLGLMQAAGKIDDRKHAKGYALVVGGWMSFITGLYLTRTYADMKRVFSETLAYEFNKDPKDIGTGDFLNSKNVIVHTTFQNFLKRNLFRTALAGSFFGSLLPFKAVKNLKIDTVDLGTGLTGGYLVSDVLWRKMTFFESLQNFIDTKINHKETIGQVITDSDLMTLYAIHARDNPPDRLISKRMDTAGWNNDRVMFSRMADLMNQTYNNIEDKEHANFTVPKLIYLLGHNLISRENKERSLAYIEVANHYGIPALKEVLQSVKEGHGLAEALQKYPVTLPDDPMAKPSPVEKKFADGISRSSERDTVAPSSSLTEQVTAKRQKADSEPQFSQSV